MALRRADVRAEGRGGLEVLPGRRDEAVVSRVAFIERVNVGERAYDQSDWEELERFRAASTLAGVDEAIVSSLQETCARQDNEIATLRHQVRMLRLVLWTLWPWRFVARLIRKVRR